jgi:hypothetical protein
MTCDMRMRYARAWGCCMHIAYSTYYIDICMHNATMHVGTRARSEDEASETGFAKPGSVAVRSEAKPGSAGREAKRSEETRPPREDEAKRRGSRPVRSEEESSEPRRTAPFLRSCTESASKCVRLLCSTSERGWRLYY